MIAHQIEIRITAHPIQLLTIEMWHASLKRVESMLDFSGPKEKARNIVLSLIVVRIDFHRTLSPFFGSVDLPEGPQDKAAD